MEIIYPICQNSNKRNDFLTCDWLKNARGTIKRTQTARKRRNVQSSQEQNLCKNMFY